LQKNLFFFDKSFVISFSIVTLAKHSLVRQVYM
jgi:hypothetical protein